MPQFNGKKLLALRKEFGLTQAKLAEKAECSVEYIRILETGKKTNPSAAIVYRLARAFDVSMDGLMIVVTKEVA